MFEIFPACGGFSIKSNSITLVVRYFIAVIKTLALLQFSWLLSSSFVWSHVFPSTNHFWNARSQPQRKCYLWELWNTICKEEHCTAHGEKFSWNTGFVINISNSQQYPKVTWIPMSRRSVLNGNPKLHMNVKSVEKTFPVPTNRVNIKFNKNLREKKEHEKVLPALNREDIKDYCLQEKIQACKLFIVYSETENARNKAFN